MQRADRLLRPSATEALNSPWITNPEESTPSSLERLKKPVLSWGDLDDRLDN